MNLKLYYFPSCPFCKKVLNYLDDNDLREYVELKNVKENSKDKKDLINIGGKYQVPCLFIDEKPLYESNDIIRWFKKNNEVE
ncbi:MAG: glutaredoxin family protein [bacterium]